MMKHFLTMLFTMLLGIVMASAQPKAGTFSIIPHVGVSLSKFSGDNDIRYANSSELSSTRLRTKVRAGVTAGADVQYQLDDYWAVSLGALYAREGLRYVDQDLTAEPVGQYNVYEDMHENVDYLRVPLLAHLYLAKGFSVKAGVMMGFKLSSKLKGDTRSVVVNKDGSYEYSSESTSIDIKNNWMKTFDFTLPVGLSYEYENVVVDAQYNIGLTNIYKGSLSDLTSRTRSLYLSVGYKF